ncbi:histidine--tRNA ligase [Cephaloticoccus capnophilus]|uniref:Histidine--tRNA ligase n=1 Tax=Cephaloticoccus capnophilus TaxID=1548208 RepID=A0A139SS63_9BACT|nr:histidine--tRNA ligase [Cephaloticoccus capnophilus]KXU37398.1 histidine--tRNA ligase [Cephaloticoccus capnophilus]
MSAFQTLPGFREFYPEELLRRNYLFRLWRQTAVNFGFSEYDAPVLEALELYKAKSGDEIEAQLFSFTDKGGRAVTLRPEMTPTVCRLVGAKANALKRPIKWFSIGEFYRYERMQRGRGRCFFQFNADIFGEPGVEAESELIGLLVQNLCAFGLTEADFFVRLSDRDLWVYYLSALGLDEPRIKAVLTAVDRYEKHGEAAFKAYAEVFGEIPAELKTRVVEFLGVKSLDGLEAILAALGDERIVARLGEWRKLLGNLEAMGLSRFVQVDLGVVRGLAYYTGFVFEAFDRKGELRAIAGGGRYNDLLGKLGYADMPAVGFAIGDMTFALLLEQRGLMPPLLSAPDVYCVIGDGEAERHAALGAIQSLRASGLRVEYSLKPLAFGKQFRAATDAGARIALIFGGDEVARGVLKLRDLNERSEREVPLAAVIESVRSAF